MPTERPPSSTIGVASTTRGSPSGPSKGFERITSPTRSASTSADRIGDAPTAPCEPARVSSPSRTWIRSEPSAAMTEMCRTDGPAPIAIADSRRSERVADAPGRTASTTALFAAAMSRALRARSSSLPTPAARVVLAAATLACSPSRSALSMAVTTTSPSASGRTAVASRTSASRTRTSRRGSAARVGPAVRERRNLTMCVPWASASFHVWPPRPSILRRTTAAPDVRKERWSGEAPSNPISRRSAM